MWHWYIYINSSLNYSILSFFLVLFEQSSLLRPDKAFCVTSLIMRKKVSYITDWFTGSTHIVLLPKNEILRNECKENNSPPIENELSILTGTF